MKNFFIAIAVAAAVLVSGVGVYSYSHQASFGQFSPTGGETYYLQSSISSTQNTVTLTSFTEPSSGIPYTMSYLNSDIEYGTIRPQTDQSEFVSFTGITQNSNGTATLTGVLRGLSRTPGTGGCVASTTLAHTAPGQTKFILSSPPCFFAEYAAKRNNESITGLWTFSSTSHPKYDSNPVIYASTDLVSYQTLLNTAIAGAATSTFTNMGIVQLATQAQIAAGTASSTAGSPLVAPNKSHQSAAPACDTVACIPVAVNRLISSIFIATSSSYWWGASTTYSGTGTTTLNSPLTIPANSTIPLYLNGVKTFFPSSNGASGTVLSNNGAGSLSWINPPVARYAFGTSTSAAVAGANGFATSTFVTIPSGVMTASSTIELSGSVTCTSGSGSGVCSIALRNSTGNTFGTCTFNAPTASGYAAIFTLTVVSQSLTAQNTFCRLVGLNFTSESTVAFDGTSAASAINTSGALTLSVVAASAANMTALINNYFLVVNP